MIGITMRTTSASSFWGTRSPPPRRRGRRWSECVGRRSAWRCWVGEAFCAYLGFYSDDAAVPPHALIHAMRAWYGAEQWLAIAAVLGFARRPFEQRQLRAPLPDHGYFSCVYTAPNGHCRRGALSQTRSTLSARRGLLLVLVTAASCFMGYEVIRRVRPLQPYSGCRARHGRKRPRRRQDRARSGAVARAVQRSARHQLSAPTPMANQNRAPAFRNGRHARVREKTQAAGRGPAGSCTVWFALLFGLYLGVNQVVGLVGNAEVAMWKPLTWELSSAVVIFAIIPAVVRFERAHPIDAKPRWRALAAHRRVRRCSPSSTWPASSLCASRCTP